MSSFLTYQNIQFIVSDKLNIHAGKEDHLKILHTSDWHLGQTLRSFDRYFEYQCI